ncbi:PorP/SprF family type IX secretion system membrane protein [Robiginitalea biformata]|uniref:SPOR domain-containing protein n=1 Tax=Robiginitalea biformata (strain ATCC BAA-864 / DSM 15991 / KCTC 12146 / HTCC2501) TaxID=313596 RepID=A4CLS9_ROBBH|nr:PorP/SprF family type IX secretion system membrane protein [Robiginitalea biformata]EAR15828.1 hypothetical protein RB2501_15909 [Robiginitalea biformata HTCC2501]
MVKSITSFVLVMAAATVFGQQEPLPPDFRQQNLLLVAPNLFNPTLSLDQQAQHRISTWSRWQWQTPDADPTTLLLQYGNRQSDMAFSGGFLQHNTQIFQQTGGFVNFAFSIPFTESINLAFGTNLFAYSQKLSDDSGILQEPILPFPDDNTDFIIQVMPGFTLNVGDFGVGMAFENLFDYSFNYRGAVSENDQKVVMGMARYGFDTGGGTAASPNRFTPLVYFKQIPGFDTQYGINASFSATRYWLQGGYNSFYGPSLGLGGRFFQNLSVGGVVEFASDNAPETDGLTYEFVASYDFGKTDKRKKVVGFDVEEDLEREAELEAARRQAEEEARLVEADSLRLAREAEATRLAEMRRDSLETVRRQEQLLAEQRRQDSIQEAERALALQEEEVTPEKGERYEELAQEGDLEPGYYLIANVFGTKRYYDAFMKQLRDAGLEPGSFYRSSNKYNYVFLRRYDSIEAARRARDSKFSGRYQGDLWILRIR